MNINAVIWDYDGTLVNSVPKNIDITKQILASVAPRLTGDNLPRYLKNEQDYHFANHKSKNWQDLYLNYYGLTATETIDAGKLWTQYQLTNTTPVNLFSEISETINLLNLPQGICSQNSAENIKQVLIANNLLHKFKAIVGYDDIPHNAQKPSPVSGITCLKRFFSKIENKTIIYVGDHEGDVKFARNIEYEVGKNNKVISVAVTYSGADINSWTHKPDHIIETPKELVKIIKL